MGEQVKVIKNWSPLTSISTFGFRATDNQNMEEINNFTGTIKFTNVN
nr:MAG: hypothetical protein [Bacteriophage sp.]